MTSIHWTTMLDDQDQAVDMVHMLLDAAPELVSLKCNAGQVVKIKKENHIRVHSRIF